MLTFSLQTKRKYNKCMENNLQVPEASFTHQYTWFVGVCIYVLNV